jgi:uncharacterized membrane protein
MKGAKSLLSYRPKLGILQHLGRLLLGLSLTFAGYSHLTFNRSEFLAQVPNWVPMDADFVVLASGVVEILLGLSLIFWGHVGVGLATALFFVLIFPGNISQYVTGTDAFGLNTDSARLIRLFFQPVLVLWALWSTGGIPYLKERRKGRQSVAADH